MTTSRKHGVPMTRSPGICPSKSSLLRSHCSNRGLCGGRSQLSLPTTSPALGRALLHPCTSQSRWKLFIFQYVVSPPASAGSGGLHTASGPQWQRSLLCSCLKTVPWALLVKHGRDRLLRVGFYYHGTSMAVQSLELGKGLFYVLRSLEKSLAPGL